MFDLFFKDMLKLSPSFASFVGIPGNDDKIEIAISPKYHSELVHLLQKYQERMISYTQKQRKKK